MRQPGPLRCAALGPELTLADPQACVAFSEPGASCGGMAPPNYQTRCAPTLECVNSMGPMVMDAPGSCAEACPIAASSPIAAREQRDSWGNCIAAGCSNWFDGCNACTSTNGMQTCTEMFCAQPTGPAECRDAPATLIKPTAAAADECCTNHRRVLGLCAPPAGCCRGITAECVACNQGCSVEAYCGPAGPGYTSGVCAQVSDAYAAHPVAPQPVGVPEGCMAWFDGCNTCERDSATGSMGCTMMYCFAPESTACRGWAVGYGDGKGH